MTRGLTSANLTAHQADNTSPIYFVQLDYDEGTDRLHTGVGPLTWGGNTWTGVGDLGSIEKIEEGTELSPFNVVLKISGLDTTALTRALSSDVFGRAVTIYWGQLDTDGSLVADPDQIWAGTMDTPEIALGGENAIALSCESDMKRFNVPNGALFTDEEQQQRYAGDLAFQYQQQLEDAKIVWRGEERVRFGAPPRGFPYPTGPGGQPLPL